MRCVMPCVLSRDMRLQHLLGLRQKYGHFAQANGFKTSPSTATTQVGCAPLLLLTFHIPRITPPPSSLRLSLTICAPKSTKMHRRGACRPRSPITRWSHGGMRRGAWAAGHALPPVLPCLSRLTATTSFFGRGRGRSCLFAPAAQSPKSRCVGGWLGCVGGREVWRLVACIWCGDVCVSCSSYASEAFVFAALHRVR